MIGRKSKLHLIAGIVLVTLAACASKTPPVADNSVVSPYAAVARGRVDVEGGLLQIGAACQGTLANIAVHEGERVSKGQTLAELDPEPAKLQVQAAQAELKQAQAEAQVLSGKLQLARRQAQRLTEAAKAGAGDAQSADVARAAAVELGARQAAADAAIGIAEQKLESARYELGLRTLRAPVNAQVTRVLAQPGASVAPQSGALFVLLPLTPLIVRAELNESLVDAVKVGMPASVSSDGAGSERNWSAHVVRIGSVVGPSVLDEDPQQRADDRTVACVLAFDQPPQLRIGQRLLVRFGTAAAATTAAQQH